MLRKLAIFFIGGLAAVFVNVAVTWALLKTGVSEGDADLAGNIVFALLFAVVLWLALRPRAIPQKTSS